MSDRSLLRWNNVDVIPLVHGRVAFAVAVRECMLSERHAALAVELPPSLQPGVLAGLDRLPQIHAVVYREFAPGGEEQAWSPERDRRSESDDEVEAATETRAWYVPIDPCDGIIEALRIARGERLPVHFVDAEVEDFSGRRFVLPDPHALLTLGVEAFYTAAQPTLESNHPPTDEDTLRERHMAARIATLAQQVEGHSQNHGRVLFLCGMAHWQRIRRHLEQKSGVLHANEGPAAEDITLVAIHPQSLGHMLGELPFVTWRWNRHRNSIELDRHDTILAMKDLLLTTRRRYRRVHQDSLERPTPAALATLLNYVRKLVVARGRLTPDLWSLVIAAKGVIGNDFALELVHTANLYPPNLLLNDGDEAADDDDDDDDDEDDEEADEDGDGETDSTVSERRARSQEPPLETTLEHAKLGDEITRVASRTPGERRTLKRVKLIDKPPPVNRELWRSLWNPAASCSWTPEDVRIENLRAYVASRTLALAGIDRVRTEEFTSSLKDGLAIRETLRDLPLGKIHVKVEPRVPGKVGAVVVIFEEDDDGTRFPFRMTWFAEFAWESTLCFYATNYLKDMVGPGIARAHYGGCLFLFPPKPVPDVWDDLRFEKARRPSERLLLAALWHARDRFVAYVSARPPAPEAVATAAAFGKHIVHLPLSTFSASTLEKLRRFHVLNGKVVRSWAARFVR